MSTTTIPDRRRASGGQGAVLLAAACMPILGSTSIAPLQPAMAAAFPDQPGAEVFAALILTVPALMIGLTAMVAGRLIDRLGRKRVLVTALLVYSLAGTAPLWLPNLQAIMLSRVVVGLAEAAIFAAAMATISDLFDGRRRARYFGLLNLVTGLSAVVIIALSGALGNQNWRAPFWLYTIAAPLALIAVLVLRREERGTARVALAPLPWRRLAAPILFTLVGGAVFYVPVAMLSFRLDELGITQTAVIGAISAGAALALALAALGFPALLQRIPRVLLAVSFALLGIGLLLIGLSPSVPVVVVGAVVANAGGGVLLSTLQTWIVQGLPYDQRGRASGASTASLFVGQFLAPLLIFAIAAGTNLGAAIALVGVGGMVAAVLGVFFGRIRSEQAFQQSAHVDDPL